MRLFDELVGMLYHMYNSLFLNLPFETVKQTGNFLPLFHESCVSGFSEGKSAEAIVDTFFESFLSKASPEERLDTLFRIVQYVERQVALFDAIEDAAFTATHDLNGLGTATALVQEATIRKRVECLREQLQEFGLRLVLTAHPTQFYPGQVLGILTDLGKAIKEKNTNEINSLLQQLGKTPFLNSEKPTPINEASTLTWYLEHVFYEALPAVLLRLMKGLRISIDDPSLSKLIIVGFWPGGDRDGNPNVTHDTTIEITRHLRNTLLRAYYKEARQMRRRLTFRGVDKLVAQLERKLYQWIFRNERPYSDPEELLQELHAIRNLLMEQHNSLFIEMVEQLILRVRAFGFHYACLDIRQDSRKHDTAWAAALNELARQGGKVKDWENFKQMGEEEQIRYLMGVDLNGAEIQDAWLQEVVGTFRAIGVAQQENGVASCHRYIISNCQSALHVMEVFALGNNLLSNDGILPLDIVPLFETINDLAHASAIMETLYSFPPYREHLSRRGNLQTIMLGFSDGTKDGGYLQANWSIYEAKERLTEIARKHGITVLFFDGRGGPPSRGGGNTHNFYASLGNSIEQKQVQITIQGQTISSNFGNPASCQYNLEQLFTAGIGRCVRDSKDNQLTNEDKNMIGMLAKDSYQSYLSLKNDPLFVRYLEQATPLLFFGEANIASRPMKRGPDASLKFEDLRAIPFVASWAMMKQNVPGFFGVGFALKKAFEAGHGERLQELFRRSLFFRTLLSNSMMSLQKTSFKVTMHLSEDPVFGDFWKCLYEEYERSVEYTLRVSNQSTLIFDNPIVNQSVQMREDIVKSLVAIQQYSLIKIRSKSATDGGAMLNRYKKLVLRCMFGIINASRNSA